MRLSGNLGIKLVQDMGAFYSQCLLNKVSSSFTTIKIVLFFNFLNNVFYSF